MKNFYWFTETKINSKERGEYSFDLSGYLRIFIENKLWEKPKYRTEYNIKFTQEDLDKIQSIKIHFHIDAAPYSNFHSYENVIGKYFDLKKIEARKIASSGISEAHRIAVIEIVYNSDKEIIPELTYRNEKNIDRVFERLSYSETWQEEEIIKSIACEFIQFFTFNLHLNFMTTDYTFSFEDKPNPIGFTIVSENSKVSYSTEKLDLLTHYILYEKGKDNLHQLMEVTSKFWSKEIPLIHFFLDAVKNNYVTSTNFIKLVFALESFFGDKISNDFISLTVPLAISDNISDMKKHRETIKKSFNLRNKIVHGNSLIDLMDMYRNSDKNQRMDELLFDLKSIIIKLFYFYISNDLFNKPHNIKINHDLLFEFLPQGISKQKKK